MDNKTAVRLFAGLAHSTRLGIVRLLVQAGPTGVAAGEIGSELRMPPATVSFHLKELAQAGLVVARQQSRFIFYSADFSQITGLTRFLTENCCAADGVSCGSDCAPASQPSRGGRRPAAVRPPRRRTVAS